MPTIYATSTLQATYTFKDNTGSVIDADTVSMVVYDPDGALFAQGTLAGGQVTHTQVGIYQYLFVPDRAGMWKVIATGTKVGKVDNQEFVQYITPL